LFPLPASFQAKSRKDGSACPVRSTPNAASVGRARSLILASASPRRRELLDSLGVDFSIVPARVDEHEASDADPRKLVAHNAALKADWVAARHPDAFVLGADTTVFIDGIVLNKPVDLDDARRMLGLLSGRTHVVFTGISLRRCSQGVSEDAGVETLVSFKKLSPEVIDVYLAATQPLDKAGAYGIQDRGEMIIDHWDGSFTNIVGLPVELTTEILTRHGLLPISR
jgi:septum formation protein